MDSFNPTQADINIAENLFVAIAHESVIREIVENYQDKILKKHQFRIAREWVDRGEEDRVILKREHRYLLDEKDLQIFLSESKKESESFGLKVSMPENDPLLEAETERIRAERYFLSAMAEATKQDIYKNLDRLTLAQYKELVSLSLRLISPYCKLSDEILGRLACQPAIV